MPLARTAMDEKSGRSLQQYAESVQGMIDSLAPWTSAEKNRQILQSKVRRKVASGTIVVIPDASDSPNDPLYQGAILLKG